MQNLETARSAEQLAFDLAKALQFTLPDLRSFRRGILPAVSCQVLLSRAVQPLFKSAAVTLGPLIVLAYITSSSHHCSLSEGLLILVSHILQIREFAETEGWFMTVIYALGGLGLLGLGIYFATRIQIDLLADILGKTVKSFDGRVTAREQENAGSTKRDALPDYYFETKLCSFLVNRRAFLAIDSGGLYRVYYLPMSKTLVAIEPTVLAKEAEEKEQKLRERPVAPSTI